jgi:putative ABC transport system permease protein
MNLWLHDLRQALRALLSHKAFFAASVLTLMLGIGAVAAVFTVYDAVLLKPLPFTHAQRIVRVTKEQAPFRHSTTSVPDFNEWRERSGDAFDAFGAYAPETMNLASDGDAQRLSVYKVTPGFWNVFSQPLALGRSFGDEEENRNEKVVVLGDGLWRTRFAADHDVIGRSVDLNGDAYRVIGVAQTAFRYPDDAQVWIPTFAPGNAQSRRNMSFLRVVARLREHVSTQQAASVMKGITDWQAANFPDEDAGMRSEIMPLQDLVSADVRQPLRMLLVAAALVLLIACANLANLMLARGQVRAQELALRRAPGARQRGIARQVAAEALLIALSGAIAGLAITKPAIVGLIALAPDLLPAYNAPQIDLRVIATITGLALGTVLLFGLWPAWRAARTDPIQALQGASRSQTGSRRQMRARAVLVSAEVALAMTLLAGAGLLIDSLHRLDEVDAGVGSSRILTAQFSLSTPVLQPGENMFAWATRATAQLGPKLDAIDARVRALPGVESLALSFGLPASGNADWSSNFEIVGQPVDKRATVQYRFVSADYFRTFDIPLEAGRVFNATDGTRALLPTELLVNQAFADRYLAGADPLSREIKTFGDAPISIIGVVGNVRQAGLDRDVNPELYFPISKAIKGDLSIAIKVSGDAMTYAEPLRRAMREVVPDAPVYELRTMDEVIGATLGLRRFNMTLMSVFAGLAVVLAAIGLFGVITYLVGQRRREIGLRQALGASTTDIHRLMLGSGLRMIIPGVLVGIAGALGLGQLIASQLYGVGAADPRVLLEVAAVLSLVTLLACALPTLRASRVAPMEALRNE